MKRKPVKVNLISVYAPHMEPTGYIDDKRFQPVYAGMITVAIPPAEMTAKVMVFIDAVRLWYAIVQQIPWEEVRWLVARDIRPDRERGMICTF